MTNTLDISWWENLSPQWKGAFAETFFQHANAPAHDELAHLYGTPVLRFAGPSAPYPNMSFELTDLSGITRLSNIQILVVVHHLIETIEALESLSHLTNLFLFNNKIKNLEGIENLTQLEQLYVQYNGIECIKPLQRLTNLRELYINDNRISSLEGLTEEHADKLEVFYCKPNEELKQKEMLRVEREIGIRCRNI